MELGSAIFAIELTTLVPIMVSLINLLECISPTLAVKIFDSKSTGANAVTTGVNVRVLAAPIKRPLCLPAILLYRVARSRSVTGMYGMDIGRAGKSLGTADVAVKF